MEGISKIWPKWEPVEVLGQGGFGIVYKAKRENFGEVLWSAIKVIKIPNDYTELKTMESSGFTEEQIKQYYKKSVTALINEIRLMDTMKSASHIVSIEDFEVVELENEIGWKVYIRMELLTNLHDYLSKKGSSVEEVRKMAIDILTALEHCHQLDIIHRDIKPANIFVSRFGEYKLGDFGISRQVEQANATMSQKGTKSYMAPEMIRLSKYGKNVDFYALGLTMYELLNYGRMPFLPKYPELFFPQDREEAIIKRLTGEAIPEIEGIGAMNRIIQKACAYDPQNRYQSATEMKNDLQHLEFSNDLSTLIQEEDDDKTINFIDTRSSLLEEDNTVNVLGNDNDLFNSLLSQETDDEKTMNVIGNDSFIFEDSTILKSENIEYVINRHNIPYYMVFTNGYYNLQDNLILTSDDAKSLGLKKLYDEYLNTNNKIGVLEKMVQLDNNAKLFATLADEYYKNNNELEAKQWYEKAYQLDSEDVYIIKRIAFINYQYGRFEKAIELANKGLENYRLGKSSSHLYAIHQLYFIKALAYQNLGNEKDAILAISELEQFNFKTYIAGFAEAKTLPEMNQSFNKTRFLKDLLTNDRSLSTKHQIFIATINFGIGANFFKEHMTAHIKEIKESYYSNANKLEKLKEKMGITYDEGYIYVTTTLFGDAIFGQYGIYKYVDKKVYYMDYYSLPYVLIGTHDSINMYIRKQEDYQLSTWRTIISGARKNPYIMLSLCEIKQDLVGKNSLPLNLPLSQVGYLCNTLWMDIFFNVKTTGELKRVSDKDLKEFFKKDINKYIYYKALKLEL